MVILHVAGLNGNKSAGPNYNVAKNIIYSNKYHKTAFYNLFSSDFSYFMDSNVYYKKNYDSISNLPSPFNKPDIVVFQSMYVLDFIPVYKEIKKMNIPYVLVPRCSLTYAAQHKRFLKKKIANLLFFNRFVRDAASINFLTQNEYLESKKCFKFKDYFINGNGVEKKNNLVRTNKEDDMFKVNFIGRIEWYHKGLDCLIDAINLGKTEFRNKKFIFKLYGPDDFNSYSKLNDMIKKYEIGDLIKICDPVFDKEKEKVYLNSDLFIHTSRLEGQPTSVIDAISYGIPVFVTPGTNIYDVVEKYELGIISEFNPEDIKNKLLEFYEIKNKEVISKNCIKYSNENFDWKKIVKKNIALYNKIVNINESK